jgi:hypothetical protein
MQPNSWEEEKLGSELSSSSAMSSWPSPSAKEKTMVALIFESNDVLSDKLVSASAKEWTMVVLPSISRATYAEALVLGSRRGQRILPSPPPSHLWETLSAK